MANETLKPASSPIDPGGIPEELKSTPNWVCWRNEPKGNDKWDKQPYIADGGHVHAKSNDQKTWRTFEEALNTYTRASLGDDNPFDGIGFMLPLPGGEPAMLGIDLDHCFEADGVTLKPAAREFVNAMPDTYVEKSPSGTGLRAILIGEKPSGLKCKWYEKGNPDSEDRLAIEVYGRFRFLTMTGGRWSSEDALGTSTPEFEEVLKTLLANGNGSNGNDRCSFEPCLDPLAGEDYTLVGKILNSAQGEKFDRLWRGDSSGYPSQSEADFALCSILSFWTGKNPQRVDRLMRASGLLKDEGRLVKWNSSRGNCTTYGSKTIAEAIAHTEEVYSDKTKMSMQALLDWIGQEVHGEFQNKDVYEILNANSENEKTTIRNYLRRAKEKGLIEPLTRLGFWRKVDPDVTDIELSLKPTQYEPVLFPGGVETMVGILPRNIIALAGTKDAGKSSYAMLFAYLNRARFQVHFFSSEMGKEDISDRIQKFVNLGYPFEQWEKIHFHTYGGHPADAIRRDVGPGALIIIDYVECFGGEYQMMGDHIRRIWQVMGDSIVLIALQKTSEKDFAQGGVATTQKPRLFMSMDGKQLTIIHCKARVSKKNPKNQCRDYEFRGENGELVWGKEWREREPLSEEVQFSQQKPTYPRQAKRSSYAKALNDFEKEIVSQGGKDDAIL
jgi:primase-polymerase (primpol)-like protein